ncbi:MAG: hypothetical protein U0T73_00370 [Chitinophagales bacterium]
MSEISTNDRLLLLAYNELNETETAALLAEIQKNETLRAEWETLQQTLQALDEYQLSPREASVRIVEEESREEAHHLNL